MSEYHFKEGLERGLERKWSAESLFDLDPFKSKRDMRDQEEGYMAGLAAAAQAEAIADALARAMPKQREKQEGESIRWSDESASATASVPERLAWIFFWAPVAGFIVGIQCDFPGYPQAVGWMDNLLLGILFAIIGFVASPFIRLFLECVPGLIRAFGILVIILVCVFLFLFVMALYVDYVEDGRVDMPRWYSSAATRYRGSARRMAAKQIEEGHTRQLTRSLTDRRWSDSGVEIPDTPITTAYTSAPRDAIVGASNLHRSSEQNGLLHPLSLVRGPTQYVGDHSTATPRVDQVYTRHTRDRSFEVSLAALAYYGSWRYSELRLMVSTNNGADWTHRYTHAVGWPTSKHSI